MEKLRETAETQGVFFTKYYHLTRQTDVSRSSQESPSSHFCFYLHLGRGQEYAHVMSSMWRWTIVQSSLHHVDPKNQTEVVRPDGKHLTH